MTGIAERLPPRVRKRPPPRRPVGTFRTAGVDCQRVVGVETRTENPLGRSRENGKGRGWGQQEDEELRTLRFGAGFGGRR